MHGMRPLFIYTNIYYNILIIRYIYIYLIYPPSPQGWKSNALVCILTGTPRRRRWVSWPGLRCLCRMMLDGFGTSWVKWVLT